MKRVLSLVCMLAIVASCLFVFASCGGATPNADSKAAITNLAANGYSVQELSGIDKMFTGCTAAFIATNVNDVTEIAEFYYFSNEEHAQKGAEALKADAETMGVNVDFCISGKVVYNGSSSVVNATNPAK